MLSSTLLRGFPHGFGERADGDGRSAHTRRQILHRYNKSAFITTRQVHGTFVHNYIHPKDARTDLITLPEGDGIACRSSDVLLGLVTADCIPILCADPASRTIGVAHAGWKGTIQNILSELLTTMEKIGASREDIRIGIGPHIGSCCYRIDASRAEEIASACGDESLVRKCDGWYFSLMNQNRSFARTAGISDDHIEIVDRCTACNPASFFSYRRDGSIRGEMLSYIGV